MYGGVGGRVPKKNMKIKFEKKKKFQSARSSPPGRWTGNDFLFKGALSEIISYFSLLFV